MPITIRAGDKVVIRGLQRNTALNGELATVQSSQGERIIVHLADGQAKALKLDNLRVPYAWCHGCAAAQVYDKQDTQSRCSVCREDFVEELLTYQDYVDAAAFYRAAVVLREDAFGVPVFQHAQERPIHHRRTPFGMFFFTEEADDTDMTPVSRGASKAAIEALETVPQSEMKADDSCPVCQDDFKEGEEEAVVKMPCGHAFHKECLLPWLESNNTCPTCRHEIPSVHSDPNASESDRAQASSSGARGTQDVSSGMMSEQLVSFVDDDLFSGVFPMMRRTSGIDFGVLFGGARAGRN